MHGEIGLAQRDRIPVRDQIKILPFLPACKFHYQLRGIHEHAVSHGLRIRTIFRTLFVFRSFSSALQPNLRAFFDSASVIGDKVMTIFRNRFGESRIARVNAAFVLSTKYKNKVCVSRARTHARFELFLPQSWVRSTRPMDNPFTYLLWPQANWSWNMYWIFYTDRPIFFPLLEFSLKIPARDRWPRFFPWKIERPFRVHERKCSWPKMRGIVTLVLLSVSLFRTFHDVCGYSILGICPSPSYSHQQPFQALMRALAARGHTVTVLSTIPLKVRRSSCLRPCLQFSLFMPWLYRDYKSTSFSICSFTLRNNWIAIISLPIWVIPNNIFEEIQRDRRLRRLITRQSTFLVKSPFKPALFLWFYAYFVGYETPYE